MVYSDCSNEYVTRAIAIAATKQQEAEESWSKSCSECSAEPSRDYNKDETLQHLTALAYIFIFFKCYFSVLLAQQCLTCTCSMCCAFNQKSIVSSKASN